MRRQRAFRPACLDGLEERLALSHGGAAFAAHEAAFVPQAQAVGLHSGFHSLALTPAQAAAGAIHAQRLSSAFALGLGLGSSLGSHRLGLGMSLPLSLQLTNAAAGLALFGPLNVGPVANPLLNSPFSNNFRVGGSSFYTQTFSSFFPRTTPFLNGFNSAGLGFNGFGFNGFGSGFGSGFAFPGTVGFFNPLGNTFNGLGMAI